MKPLVLFLSIVLFSSCAVKKIPIKGTYPNPPITESTTTPMDSVWSNLVDYIAQRGMGIKIIDKSSGLLVTEDYTFKGLYTHETKTGQLRDPNAFLVTSRIKTANTTEGSIGPSRVIVNWNVRLKPQGAGTLINVNITNLRTYEGSIVRGRTEYDETTAFDVQSTGKFERMIIDNIK